MDSKLNISILTDSTSWMNKYNSILKDELEKLGHKVNITSSKNKIGGGGDIAFFLSCFEIVGEDILRLSKHNIVVHASDLPQGKGWSPMSWQILEGKDEIPITLFETDSSADSGDFYLKDKILLDGTELVDEWQEKLGKVIIKICLDYINNYANLSGIAQSGKESFYPRRRPNDSKLDINKTIKEQFNLLRIVDNDKYPAFLNTKIANTIL